MTTAPIPPGQGPGGQYPGDQYRGGQYPGGQYPDGRYPDGQYPDGPARRSPRPRSARPQVDAGRLWAGGVATAVVAALIALVGVLVCRWLFQIPLLSPKQDGAYGDVHTTDLMLAAAAAALVATALAHLLLLGTPRPLSFLAWIITLATVLAVLLPFSTAAPLSAKIATAAVDLVLGVAIGSLTSGVAARSVRITRGPGGGVPGGSVAGDWDGVDGLRNAQDLG
ncbi:MAG TPA: DUF6069 family protein [Streptosporangiaceae bacterium]